MVLTFFLASLFVLAALSFSLLAAFAVGFSFLATFAFSLLAAVAFTLAFGFLVAGAVFRADAVFAVGGQADTVRTGHLAVMHTSLVSLLHLAGVLCGGVFCRGVAVAGNHSECESDSEESGH